MISSVFQIGLIFLVCTVEHSFVDEPSSPHYATTAVGVEIRLNCSIDTSNVHWYKYMDKSSKEIYGRGIIYEEFRERFSIANGSKADLVIRKVEPSDVGKYKCLNEDNEEQKYLLIVLGNNFTCTFTVYPDDNDWKFCGPFDSISITCKISYHGEVPPKIRWKKRRGNDDETVALNNVTDNSSTPFAFSSTVQVRWEEDSSEDDFTIVAFVDHMETSSHQYEWKSPTYKTQCTVENLSTEAQQKAWTTTDSTTDSTDKTSNNNLPIIISVSVLGFAIAVVSIGLFILCLWCKRKRRGFFKRRGNHNERGENQPLLRRRRKSSESIELIIVRGIAALKDKIYIIFQDRSFIRVIGNTEEFVKEDDIQILGIKEPWSLEAYKDDNYLYISDRKHKCIWRVTVTSGEKGLTKRICELHNPYKFSVASGGRLVIPMWPNSLQIRNSDGSIEKTIALHKDMQEPYYALETSRETFVVAHGHEKSQLQGVCEVRPIEHEQCLVKWSFPEGDSDKIWNIDQLAMDEDGRIYVTDQNKGRILVLDKDGKKICESNTEKLPYRLCYAAEKKQLLVGHYGAVSVYTLESEEGQGAHTDNRMLQLLNMFKCDKLSRNENVLRSSGPVILGSNLRLEEYKTNMDIGDLVVTGIAELDGRLNVVFQERNFIRVYKAVAPFENEPEKMLEKLEDPFFMAACTFNSCLYVTDKKRKKVLKVDINYRVNEWEMPLEEPYRLSVISEGRVLIPKWSSKSLEMYDTNGNNLKIISLPSEIIEPWHAVEMREGVFAVGHGDKTSPRHRVCMIKCKPDSSMSELTLTFGDERGGYKNDAQLNRPRSLAIDEDGRVIIADAGNMRVVILDVGWKTFASVKTTITPDRLCYCKESKQIFIGYFGTINTVAARPVTSQL